MLLHDNKNHFRPFEGQSKDSNWMRSPKSLFLQFFRFFLLSVRGSQNRVQNFFSKNFIAFSCLEWLNSQKKWKKFFSKFFENFENFIFGTFCPKKGQNDFFLKNLIRPLFTPYIPLTSCKKSEKTNDSILRKIPKTSFLGHFWPFFAVFGQIWFGHFLPLISP